MSDILGLAVLKVKGDSTELPSDLNRAGKQVKDWMGTLQGWAASALAGAGLGLGIGTVLGYFRTARDAAEEQAAADRKLEAVLIATSHAAGLSSEALRDHASELQAATGTSDDAIEGFQATLLTFKNVQGDVFKRATSLALDLQEVYGLSLPSAAKLLGQALNDPINGANALSRMMGKLSDEEKKTLETLVATGKGAEAQGMILDKLAGKVGGVAARTAGPMKLAKAALAEAYETLGTKLTPAYTSLIGVQTRFIEGLAMITSVGSSVVKSIISIDDATGHFASTTILATVATATWSAMLGAGGLAGMFPKVIAGVRAMQAAITAALTSSVWGIPIVAIGLIIGAVVSLVNWISGLPGVTEAWTAMWADLQVAVAYVGATLLYIGRAIMTAIAPQLAYIFDSWQSFRESVGAAVSEMLRWIGAFFVDWAEWIYVIATNWTDAWNLITAGAEFAGQRLMDVFKNAFDFIYDVGVLMFQALWENMSTAKVAQKMLAIGKEHFGKMSPESQAAWEKTTDAAATLWQKKLTAAGNRANFMGGPEAPKKNPAAAKQDFNEAADKLKEKLTGIFGFDELSKRMQDAMMGKDDKQQKLVDLGEENIDLQEEQLASSKKTEAGVTKLAGMIEVATA